MWKRCYILLKQEFCKFHKSCHVKNDQNVWNNEGLRFCGSWQWANRQTAESPCLIKHPVSIILPDMNKGLKKSVWTF